MCSNSIHFCSLVETQPWVIAFVMELWSSESSLLINKESAQWGRRGHKKNRKRTTKACPALSISPSWISLLSPCSPSTPWPPPQLKKLTEWPLCKHKAICYSLTLDCASVLAVRCPSNYSFLTPILNQKKKSQYELMPHFLLFTSHELRNCNWPGVVSSQVFPFSQ